MPCVPRVCAVTFHLLVGSIIIPLLKRGVEILWIMMHSFIPPPPAGASSSESTSCSSIMNTSTNAQSMKSSSPQLGKNLKRSSSEISGARSNNSDRGGIDTHPYMRGSVIEVIYGGLRKVENSDLEEDYNDEDDEVGIQDDFEKESNIKREKGEIRLADIIDRAPSDTPNHEEPAFRFKYYIHYRDYNRRMDEWISDPHRIVSPPSVGNAKVREMKKAKAKAAKEEEERKNREKLRQSGNFLEEGSKRRKISNIAQEGQTISPGGRTSSQRLSSRRAIAAISGSSASASGITSSLSTSSNINPKKNSKPEDGKANSSSSNSHPFLSMDSNATGLEDNEQLRLTRRQRRKVRSQTTEQNEPPQVEKSSMGLNVITTLLPGQDNIKDKVVTVAARELDEHEGLDEASLREHEEVTKVKNVAEVQLGRYRMNAWYFSPIPKELLQNGNTVEVLYVCEFTLNFFPRKEELIRFQAKHLATDQRHPPGNEIYRNGKLSMFEIDGFEERMYCQNLCFIAKLFLDHKTLYFDVDPFLFYVLCEVDERGFHPVGYYSKEKYSDVGFNLACILTFPCHQRKGYGRFLIDFSYELSKKEEKVGSPEKPMSDLGQQAYKPYWTSTIVDFLLNQCDIGSMSIMEISKKTSIMAEDIIFTLNVLGLLKYINGIYFITAEKKLLQQLSKKHPLKEPRVDPSKLHWSPYLTDVKRDKFSIHSKKPSTEGGNNR